MKNLILLALLLCLNSLYSQTTENKMKVNSFIVESNNKKELKDFKWKKVKKFFKQNDKNDSIKIVIIFKNEQNDNLELKIKLNNLKTEVKGQTFELNKMIRTAKKITNEMLKIEME